MARIRTIKPKFWDDIKLGKISRDARLLFIAMWNFCDDNGVIINNTIWLKSKVFPYDQIQVSQFEKWLAELIQSGFISQFSHKSEDFYYLPNFVKHQVINKPNLNEVFVPKKELERLLLDSVINTGTITDQSRIDTSLKGKEEERKGREWSAEGDAFAAPSLQDVISYFRQKGYSDQAATRAFEYYETNNWKDSRQKQVKNWKQKMIAVWFKDENKAPQRKQVF